MDRLSLSVTGDPRNHTKVSLVRLRFRILPVALQLIGEIGVVRINDRESYQVIIEDSPTTSIQLFFDVESGLDLRRVNVTNTMGGPLNVE